MVLDLTSAPLTKLKYLFSPPKSGIFVQAAHQNYCTPGACSEKNLISQSQKITLRCDSVFGRISNKQFLKRVIWRTSQIASTYLVSTAG